MLYLVTPTGLEWVAGVDDEVVKFARENEKDLGSIEGWWQPTESIVRNEDHVRSALRWGAPSARGIVVAAWRCHVLQRPRELEALLAESVPRMRAYRESDQVKAIDSFLEAQMPGWTEHGRKLDGEVEQSMLESLHRAREEAERELANVAVSAELRSHWATLGGALPDPA